MSGDYSTCVDNHLTDSASHVNENGSIASKRLKLTENNSIEIGANSHGVNTHGANHLGSNHIGTNHIGSNHIGTNSTGTNSNVHGQRQMELEVDQLRA